MGKNVIREIPLCKACYKPIKITRSRDYDKIYCDHKCAGSRNRRQDKICPVCKKSFHPATKPQILCSTKCAAEYRTSTYSKKCEGCGKDFILHNRAYEKRGKGRFCSQKCAARKYQVNQSYFREIDTPEKAYWLGFLFADGYQNGEEMVVNLATKDREHLVKLQSALDAEQPVKDTHRVSLRIASKELCADLNEHNCVQAKSLILGKPKGVPDDYMPDFIRGYFDGDGHVQKPDIRGGRCSMHCAGEEFRNWLLEVLSAIGIRVHNPANQKGRNIVISDVLSVKKFYDFIYANEGPCLERKRIRFVGLISKLDYRVYPELQAVTTQSSREF